MDLTQKIKSVSLTIIKSKKTGLEYPALEVSFVNGYSHKIFLKSEQEFILRSMK